MQASDADPTGVGQVSHYMLEPSGNSFFDVDTEADVCAWYPYVSPLHPLLAELSVLFTKMHEKLLPQWRWMRLKQTQKDVHHMTHTSTLGNHLAECTGTLKDGTKIPRGPLVLSSRGTLPGNRHLSPLKRVNQSSTGKGDLNPISPCGACMEWLRKIAEKEPNFRVITFESYDCDKVYVKRISALS